MKFNEYNDVILLPRGLRMAKGTGGKLIFFKADPGRSLLFLGVSALRLSPALAGLDLFLFLELDLEGTDLSRTNKGIDFSETLSRVGVGVVFCFWS